MKFKIYVENRDLFENWITVDKDTIETIEKEYITKPILIMQTGKTTEEYEKEKNVWKELLKAFYMSIKFEQEKEKEEKSGKKHFLKNITFKANDYEKTKNAILNKLNKNEGLVKNIEKRIEELIEVENMSDAQMFSNGKGQSNNTFR